MIRILHAADLHLDSPFSGLTPEEARRRRRESRRLPERLADLVLARGVDLVLLAGDLFDGERVYPETLEALRAALARMGCPVVIAPGNHDPYISGSPYARGNWPENVHIFRESALKALEFPDLGCTVYGAAFTDTLRTDAALDCPAADSGQPLRLLCLHGEIDRQDSRYGPVLSGQLEAWGFHYAALGHIHACSGLQRGRRTCWAYSGCTEGRGFDETGEKGVLLCEVDEKGATAAFLPLEGIRYHSLSVDVTGVSCCAALESALADAGERDICRVRLTGECESAPDLRELERRFAPRCCRLELRDETRPAAAVWAEEGEETLRGLFLRELRRQYDAAADEAQREKILLAVRFGLAALDGRDL